MLSRTRLRVAAGTLLAAVAAVLALAAFSPAHASALEPTSTILACDDEVTLPEYYFTCVATVVDNGSPASTPTGTVTFRSDDNDNLTAGCTLSSGSSCVVQLYSALLGVGTYTIDATYGGDALHSSSSGAADVRVVLGTSSTSVTCSPGTVRVGESSTCEATVTGIYPPPDGTVTFSPAGFLPAACTLSPSDPVSASCESRFTPAAADSDQTVTIVANYSGSAYYAASDGWTWVTVLAPLLNYQFLGFFEPVNNDQTNVLKAGAAVPIRWHLSDAAGPVTDPASFRSLTSTRVAGATCEYEPSDVVEELATGASGLQNLGGGDWQYNWKTSSSYKNQCRTMTLTLSDNSTYTANFQFR